jgi:adenosylmethionine-8-amino-7-oxononanoate aminotransferase
MILRNNGDILVLAPPLVVTRAIIDAIVAHLEAGIQAALQELENRAAANDSPYR